MFLGLGTHSVNV